MCVFSSSAAVVLEAAIAEEVVVTKRHSYVGRGENKIERVGKVGGGREEKRRESLRQLLLCSGRWSAPSLARPPPSSHLNAELSWCLPGSLALLFFSDRFSFLSLFSSETFRGRKKGSENDRSTNLNFFWSG